MSALRPLAAALLTGLLLLPAAPASAAGGISAPGPDAVVEADAVIALRAVVDGPATRPSELTLQEPGSVTAQVVAVSTAPEGGELAADLDTACASRLCTGREPARNGTWTLRLSGAATDERTFVLRIPPAAPDAVAAEPSESGVVIRWRQGDEPDLTGYAVEDGAGRVVVDGLGLDEACDAERTCRVELPEQAGTWTVRAFRATCPDCTDVLASPASAPVRAQAPAPLAPDLVPAEPAGPTPSGAPRQPVPDQGAAFTGAFGTGSGRAPQAAAPAAAAPALVPRSGGTYDASLGYGQRELVVPGSRPPVARAQDAVTSLLGNGERVRLLVLSALMLAGSLWLRRWARRAIAE